MVEVEGEFYRSQLPPRTYLRRVMFIAFVCICTLLFAAEWWYARDQVARFEQRQEEHLQYIHRAVRLACQEDLSLIDAQYVSDYFESYQADSLRILLRESGTRISLLDANGTVLFDSFSKGVWGSSWASFAIIKELQDDQNKQLSYENSGGYGALASIIEFKGASGCLVLQQATWSESRTSFLQLLTMSCIVAIAIFAAYRFVYAIYFRAFHRLGNGALHNIRRGAPLKKYEDEHEAAWFANILYEVEHILRGHAELQAVELQNFRQMFEVMEEALLLVRKDGTLLFANSALSKLTELEVGDVQGTSIWKSQQLIPFFPTLREAFDHNAPVKNTILFQATKNSPERRVDTQVFIINDTEGRAMAGLLVLDDVTDMFNLQRMRQDFIANVSHELKTPLTAIRGFLETLLEDAEMPNKQRQGFLERGHMQTLRLSELVHDLLTLSQLETAGYSLELDDIYLEDVVDEVVDRISPMAEQKSITIEVVYDDNLPLCHVDSEAMEQAVGNLVSNAVRYSPEKSIVRIAVVSRGDELAVHVSDTGIGIPRHMHDRIFERFFRVDRARSRNVGGTGLGLSIVRHVMQLHNGRIELESAEGEGSTFTLVFPIGRDQNVSEV